MVAIGPISENGGFSPVFAVAGGGIGVFFPFFAGMGPGGKGSEKKRRKKNFFWVSPAPWGEGGFGVFCPFSAGMARGGKVPEKTGRNKIFLGLPQALER